MKRPFSGILGNRLLLLALCTLMALFAVQPCVSLAGVYYDPGIPLTFRGLQFLPVSMTDDPELIGRESTADSSAGWVLLVRIRCLDGPLSTEDAEILRDNITVFTAVAGKSTTWDYSLPKEIILPDKASPVFDLIIRFPEKQDMEHLYASYYDLFDFQQLTGLPETEGTLAELLPEDAAASPVTLCPPPTPSPSPEPSPTPLLEGMSGSERNELEKKVKAIMKDESMTYPALRNASYLNPVEGRLLIAVFSSDGKLQVSTLDNGFDHQYFGRLNRNRLAFSYKDAKTWILIYPEYKYSGRYSDGSKGYKTYTRMAVVYKDRIQGFNIATDDPPASVTRPAGSPKTDSFGSFDIYTALRLIEERIR